MSKEAKDNLNDILDKEEGKSIIPMITSSISGGLGVVNPILGLATDALFKGLESASNTFNLIKLQILLNGLTKNGDLENHKNFQQELYDYVNKGSHQALIVGETVRKALNTDSNIAITLMGYMLEEAIRENKTQLSHNEQIIFRALSSATDKDLINFYGIYKKFRMRDGDIEFNCIEYWDEDDDSWKLTSEWCVYNRIFKQELEGNNEDHGFWDAGGSRVDNTITTKYKTTKVADELFSLMELLPNEIIEVVNKRREFLIKI